MADLVDRFARRAVGSWVAAAMDDYKMTEQEAQSYLRNNPGPTLTYRDDLTEDQVLNEIVDSQEVGHWVAAPMKDVGTSEQFHEVAKRAASLAAKIIFMRKQIASIRDILSKS